ncbi:hypothetical protein [Mycolicibacterium iranicum]|uniref:Uncharacterized protein n=1 Tax=Mycolicibacterium iranicum TaxID=912594 RepID=A0A1X1WAV5_MYCIR|nr:hypothetical protein [Mycolicibacterium iranicum]ORV83640.1 hypothetical protein AWC12_24985 [Mycolicibacterium iranicum]
MAAIAPGNIRARKLIRYRLLYWLLGGADATADRREPPAPKKAPRARRREDFIEEAAMTREMHRL